MATRKTGNSFTDLRKKIVTLEKMMKESNEKLICDNFIYEEWEKERKLLYNEMISTLDNWVEKFKKVADTYELL